MVGDMKYTSLDVRMKRYEAVSDIVLMRRTPVILRFDMCHGHTFTKGFDKPFDSVYMATMQKTMEALCNDIQGAVYQEIVYQNTKKELPFFLDIATKETLPHLDLCEIKQYDLDDALSNVEKNVPRFQAIKNGLIEPERCEDLRV